MFFRMVSVTSMEFLDREGNSVILNDNEAMIIRLLITDDDIVENFRLDRYD